MVLPNKLNITNQIELHRAEEKLSKQKAKALFATKDIDQIEVGTFTGLSQIHAYLFGDIYEFAGKIRTVNIAKGNFRFVPLLYLDDALKHISAMPQGDFNQIIEKYVEMNIAHPFREGNGRTMRIWLDVMLRKEIRQVIDWNMVQKTDYLHAMEQSPANDQAIKELLRSALTDKIDDATLFMQGVDVSYFYEGYNQFRTEDL